MAAGKGTQPETVESLSRGLDVLDLFTHQTTELTVVEVSRHLGVSQSTAYRLLQTLQRKGFMTQNPDTHRYGLSLRVVGLASVVLDSMDLRRQALPEMEELAKAADAKANLAVREDTELVYVARVESPKVPRMFFHLGKRAPLNATGLGKALLFHLDDGELAELLPRLSMERLTSHTITDRDRLLADLHECRPRGYALDLGEYLEEVNCMAVPIFDRSGQVAAAISISGPAVFLTPQRLEDLREHLLRAGQIISHKLGYWV
ncbi:MAG TPA: IclR family transcriptional regulator [Symbiobacteriaceae bacterium]|nr:IclR family transcriptional regulator [Symbiobacteriaceae bacterium]